MEITKWNDKTTALLAWLDHNDAGALAPLVEMQIEVGNNAHTDEQRGKFWEAIRATLNSLGERSPIRRGAGSSLTAEQQAVVENAVNRIYDAYAALSDFELIRVVFPQSTKMGFYPDAQAMASHMAKKASTNLRTALKQERWDGTMEGLSTILPPFTNDDGGEEE